MSEGIQNKPVRKVHLKKYIIAEQYILLRDIEKVFKCSEIDSKKPTREKSKDLNKKSSNEILSKIMIALWKGEINLISFPDRLGWCKGPYPTTHIHTREGFRLLLIHEAKFKKRRDKKSRDEINTENSSKEFIIKDGCINDRENSTYAFYLRKKWLYYQKIIDNLDKQYIDQLDKRREEIKNNGNFRIDLFIRLNLFIHLSTLAIDINDPTIIKIVKTTLSSTYYNNTIINYLFSKNEQSRITPIDRDSIWGEYLRLKKTDKQHIYEKTKGKSDAKIAKEIYDLYPGRVSSCERVLKIISEEKRRRSVKTDGWQGDSPTVTD